MDNPTSRQMDLARKVEEGAGGKAGAPAGGAGGKGRRRGREEVRGGAAALELAGPGAK